MRRLAPLVVTVGVETAAVVAVIGMRHHPDVAIEWGDLGSWLRIASPEVVLTAAAFHVGAVATGWVLITTLAYLLARTLRMGRAASALSTATLPIARRAIDRAILVVATTATLSAPVAAPAQESTELTPPGTESIGWSTATPTVADASRPPPVTVAPDRYVVRRGDSFWRIAAAHVRTPADVAAYWVRLVSENKGSLRSGNPDLIYPGEEFVLPPLEDGP